MDIKGVLHNVNNKVQWGWSHWLSTYISMLSAISIIEILIAKLFPSFLLKATALNIILLIALVYVSYWLGKKHEEFEREQQRKENKAKRP